MERRTELTLEEMQAILARRVRALYGIRVEEYRAARRAGTLPYHPEGTALAVFSGEAGERHG